MRAAALLKAILSTALEAIFPVSKSEREVLSMDPKKAWYTLRRAKKFPSRESCAIFAYKDRLVSELVWCLKYKKSICAANICAVALIRVLVIYTQVAKTVIVVPMPMTGRRKRERGFNQIDLLAEAIERNLLPDQDGIMIARGLLTRKLHRSRQTLKNRKERLEGAENIFAVDSNVAENIQSKKIRGNEKYMMIVIDDVITTGSTMEKAVDALRLAGFDNSFGLSVAH